MLGGLNPDLRVPTLVLDDGRPIAESGAILWYFGEGTRFVPDDRYERAKVLQWMFFEQYTHEPAIAVVRFLVAYSGEPREACRPDRDSGRSRATGRSTRWSGTSAAAGVPRRLGAHARRHRALRVHARRARGPLRPRALPGDRGLARARRRRAGARHDRRMTVRVRFAPSPTGSLHLGNALAAVANRSFADEHDGALVLRIDDTDPSRTVPGGEAAILADLAWLGVGWDEGPLRQSERGRRLRRRRPSSPRRRVGRRGIPTARSASAR